MSVLINSPTDMRILAHTKEGLYVLKNNGYSKLYGSGGVKMGFAAHFNKEEDKVYAIVEVPSTPIGGALWLYTYNYTTLDSLSSKTIF